MTASDKRGETIVETVGKAAAQGVPSPPLPKLPEIIRVYTTKFICKGTETYMTRTTHVLAALTLALPMLVWCVSTGSPVAAAPQAPANHPEMPDGPGKDITIATCTKCHSITNITGQHKDKDGWTATITKMVGYGATGSDDDFEAILNYVTKNYGLEPSPADKAAPPADKPAPPAAK